MQNTSDIRSKVHACISDMLKERGDKAPFDDKEHLASSGRLDSLNTVQLIVFLEKEFGLNLSNLEFDVENFESVDSIVSMIENHKC